MGGVLSGLLVIEIFINTPGLMAFKIFIEYRFIWCMYTESLTLKSLLNTRSLGGFHLFTI